MLVILFYLILAFSSNTPRLGQSDWFDRRLRSSEIFFHHPREFNWLARSFRTHLERMNQYYDEDQDITLDFKKYIFEYGPAFHQGNIGSEIVRAILSRGAISLIVQEGQWYLRVNIPILLPYHTVINVPPDRKERLITRIKNEISEISQRGGVGGGWTVFYYEGADTFDILIEAWP